MGLFRKKALQNSSSLSDIGKGIAGIRISVWQSVLGIGLCAVIFMVWFIFGTVYETVSVTGIMWPMESGGTFYAETTGVITETIVNSGEEVESGDILAIISDDDLLSQLETVRQDDSFAELQKNYIEKTVIRSHTNGIVSYIANKDTRVTEGDVIAKVIPFDENGNNQRITTFIPTYNLNQIQNGMEVQIVPEFASLDKDGYVYGYVSEVEKYPITGEDIKTNYDSIFSLGMDLQQKYIRVEITMVSDANSKSGLKWSNSNSEKMDIELGTICNCEVITDKLHPYQYLIR